MMHITRTLVNSNDHEYVLCHDLTMTMVDVDYVLGQLRFFRVFKVKLKLSHTKESANSVTITKMRGKFTNFLELQRNFPSKLKNIRLYHSYCNILIEKFRRSSTTKLEKIRISCQNFSPMTMTDRLTFTLSPE